MRIELNDIHKYYGTVKANQGVSLTVRAGSIHGLLGENGAGKSTLMKILTGFTPMTRGRIELDGKTVHFQKPADAARAGIGMLYQEPLDFPPLSALENFKLGQQPIAGDGSKSADEILRSLAKALAFDIEPDIPVARLTVGERQQLELMRLLAAGVATLILDEPTTGISAYQKEVLFKALKKLAADGKSVILVSHKLEDVEALCDDVTVLRQGKVTGNAEAPFDTDALLAMMFGKAPETPQKTPRQLGQPVLQVTDVSASGGRAGLKNCSVEVKQGELVGLAGLEGSGQGVFLRVASGLRKCLTGQLKVVGNPLTGKDAFLTFIKTGGAFLPGSRLEEGLIPGLSVTEHYALGQIPSSALVKWPKALDQARQGIEKFNIKGEPQSDVMQLSGGNQQRLLLSFLPRQPKLLLLENPTRGLDIHSAHWVWRHLQQFQAQGTTIVFSSAEIDEILMVAERVIVFHDGVIVDDTPADATDIDRLGRAISGKR